MATPNIFQQYLREPKSAFEYAAEYGQARDVAESNALKRAANLMQVQQATEEQRRQNAIRAVYESPEFLQGDAETRAKLLEGQGPKGFELGQSLRTSAAQQAESKTREQAAKLEFDEKKRASQIQELLGYTSAAEAIAGIQRKIESGEVSSEAGSQAIAKLQSLGEDSTAFQKHQLTAARGMLPPKEQILLAREDEKTAWERQNPGFVIQESKNADGSSSYYKVNKLTGAATPVTVGESGQPTAAQPGQPTAVTRGVRNNNRGNLRYAGQPGATQDKDGFAVFPTMEAGDAAAQRQLGLYGARGVNTIEGAISRWAPPNENNTQAYIQFVSQRLGIDPRATINLQDPAVQQRLSQAIFEFENGPASTSGGVVPAAQAGQQGRPLTSAAAPKKESPPAGYRWSADGSKLEPIPGGPAEGGKPLTEGQAKANIFGSRAQEAHAVIEGLGDYNSAAITTKARAEKVPVIGDILGAGINILSSEKTQKAEQAQRNFINAVLRRESGAVISEEEFKNATEQYFPKVGDTAAVIEQKRKNRETAIAGLRAELPGGKFIGQDSAPARGQPVQVRNANDYNALPSGTIYMTPDGTQKRKP